MHLLAFLSLILFVLNACHQPKPRALLGQRCEVDECAEGLLCLNKFCTEPAGSNFQKVIVQAPRDLRYTENPAFYAIDASIPENKVFYQGDEAQKFVVDPDLPAGLFLDPAKGTISGIPRERSPAKSYVISATNDAGLGFVKLEITVRDVPLAPSLKATAFYQNASLSWSPDMRASSYELYWNTTGNVGKTDQKIENIAETSFVHMTPRPGVKYYYRVLGVGVDGEGELSNEVSIETYGVAAVSAGGEHTCVIVNEGKLRCWGRGDYGELGYGDFYNIYHPRSDDIPIGKAVFQLAAGGYHTCVLLDDGSIKCWGMGKYGQLGNNSSSNFAVPGSDILVGGEIVRIGSAGAHSCAVLQDGGMRCWGQAGFGQLGYGKVSDVGTGAPGSLSILDVGKVHLDGEVVQIVGGTAHTCVLLKTGGVRCWGWGNDGQLGYGDKSTLYEPINGDVHLGSEAIQVAASGSHSCALLKSGGVRCWGRGVDGQLGYGNTDSLSAPSDTDIPLGEEAIQITAGLGHTCALLKSNGVRCWGMGTSGQLGYGDANTSKPDSKSILVGGDVIQITAGGYHTCALLRDGRLRCWGKGSAGQLGYGDSKNVGTGAKNDSNTPTIIDAGDVPVF